MMNKEERKSKFKNVSVEMTITQWEALARAAKMRRMSKSELIRVALVAYLSVG